VVLGVVLEFGELFFFALPPLEEVDDAVMKRRSRGESLVGKLGWKVGDGVEMNES